MEEKKYWPTRCFLYLIALLIYLTAPFMYAGVYFLRYYYPKDRNYYGSLLSDWATWYYIGMMVHIVMLMTYEVLEMIQHPWMQKFKKLDVWTATRIFAKAEEKMISWLVIYAIIYLILNTSINEKEAFNFINLVSYCIYAVLAFGANILWQIYRPKRVKVSHPRFIRIEEDEEKGLLHIYCRVAVANHTPEKQWFFLQAEMQELGPQIFREVSPLSRDDDMQREVFSLETAESTRYDLDFYCRADTGISFSVIRGALGVRPVIENSEPEELQKYTLV